MPLKPTFSRLICHDEHPIQTIHCHSCIYSLPLQQACFLAIKEKTQNSRTKLKFSAFKSGEIEVNIGMKCFFTSTFKGKDYGKYQKGTTNLRNMNRSQNSSKTFQKLKKKLKTQGKNSRNRHLINI